jgi:hypothetical protein
MLPLASVYEALARPLDVLAEHGSLNARHYGCAIAATFVALAIADRIRLGGRAWVTWKRIAAVISLCCVAALLLSSLTYALSPGFSDHVEPSVVVIAELWGQGKPLYPDPLAAERYAIQYGPLTYIANSFVLSATGGDIRAVKAFGLAALVAGLALIGISVRRSGNVVVCLGYAAVAILFLERCSLGCPVASWIRPDPQLFFWASAGMYCATLSRRAMAVVGTGVAMGMCVCLKLHGAVYLLPALMLIGRGHRVCSAVALLLVAALVALLPFVVFTNISWRCYAETLIVSAHHGLDWGLLQKASCFAAFLLSPLAAMFCANILTSRGADLKRCLDEQGGLMAAIAMATLLVAVPASKAGAGPGHLLPLIPAYTLALGTLIAWPRQTAVVPRLVIYAALSVVGAFVILGTAQAFCAAHVLWGKSGGCGHIAHVATSEIRQIRARFRGASIGMGFGGRETYEWTYYRTCLDYRATPYLLDTTSIMDFAKARIPLPDATYAALRRGDVKIWILPAGEEPFSLPSFYAGSAALFDERFCRAFHACYRRETGTEHYDVWVQRR